MTGAMGDRVPPLTMTDAQEARLERLQDGALEAIARIQPREVYEEMALADWAENLCPEVPVSIPDHGDVGYESLTRVQRDAYSSLTEALRTILATCIDDEALRSLACGGGEL